MKIGMMTMHRVQNVGSVLQAYALQQAIRQLGYESELIDYVFPPDKGKKAFSVKGSLAAVWDLLQGCPQEKRLRKIAAFRRAYLRCSERTYTRAELSANPPRYDIYCTGSDQVWNPRHVKDDTSFMLDFAQPDAPRFAYASSFASKEVPEPYFSLYAKHLSRYDHITVREQSGAGIVKAMTGRDATVVCDPTLLLTADEWKSLADGSGPKRPGGYILVYLLGYMFNPRPRFYDLVEVVRKASDLPVYQYNPYTFDGFHRHIKAYKGQGPADFVRLFRDASFVVTDSFHGTAFATIFNVPMIGVVKDEQDGDGRIATLRAKVDGGKSVVYYKQAFSMQASEMESFGCDPVKTGELRDYSLSELRRMLGACTDNKG